MYNTREIRWFTPKENKSISQWFNNRGLFFSEVEKRTDMYLVIPGNEEVNIKLREGNIEIKTRTGKPESSHLIPGMEMLVEKWVKWSFTTRKDDELSQKIIENKYNWLAVDKTRLGVILGQDDQYSEKFYDIGKSLPDGCQIEYTRIKVKNQQWFSFNLEFFGENPPVLKSDTLIEITGKVPLNPECCMGYPRFLQKFT